MTVSSLPGLGLLRCKQAKIFSIKVEGTARGCNIAVDSADGEIVDLMPGIPASPVASPSTVSTLSVSKSRGGVSSKRTAYIRLGIRPGEFRSAKSRTPSTKTCQPNVSGEAPVRSRSPPLRSPSGGAHQAVTRIRSRPDLSGLSRGTGHRKENIQKEVSAVRPSARLHRCWADPHTNLGQMDSSVESPEHLGGSAITLATASPASLRPVFQSGA